MLFYGSFQTVKSDFFIDYHFSSVFPCFVVGSFLSVGSRLQHCLSMSWRNRRLRLRFGLSKVVLKSLAYGQMTLFPMKARMCEGIMGLTSNLLHLFHDAIDNCRMNGCPIMSRLKPSYDLQDDSARPMAAAPDWPNGKLVKKTSEEKIT